MTPERFVSLEEAVSTVRDHFLTQSVQRVDFSTGTHEVKIYRVGVIIRVDIFPARNSIVAKAHWELDGEKESESGQRKGTAGFKTALAGP